MKNDPSRQTLIYYLREAAIDSNHAERIVASIIMFGRDRTFLARRISSPRGHFSKEASSAYDQAPVDQRGDERQDQKDNREDEEDS